MPKNDVFQTPDSAVRALARRLIDDAAFAALAVTDPDTGAPSVTRIALATDPKGNPLSLVSSLSAHTSALEANPTCALLIGEPGEKGDPLTHPRLTVHATAHLVAREAPDRLALRDHYLAQRPKAKLYIDFPDFRMLRFEPLNALMNGGFGKAYRFTRDDLTKP